MNDSIVTLPEYLQQENLATKVVLWLIRMAAQKLSPWKDLSVLLDSYYRSYLGQENIILLVYYSS